MLSLALLWGLAVTSLRALMNNSLAALPLAALVYVLAATAVGLVVSTFMRSRIAALFGWSENHRLGQRRQGRSMKISTLPSVLTLLWGSAG